MATESMNERISNFIMQHRQERGFLETLLKPIFGDVNKLMMRDILENRSFGRSLAYTAALQSIVEEQEAKIAALQGKVNALLRGKGEIDDVILVTEPEATLEEVTAAEPEAEVAVAKPKRTRKSKKNGRK